jgi:hypothetical protein
MAIKISLPLLGWQGLQVIRIWTNSWSTGKTPGPAGTQDLLHRGQGCQNLHNLGWTPGSYPSQGVILGSAGKTGTPHGSQAPSSGTFENGMVTNSMAAAPRFTRMESSLPWQHSAPPSGIGSRSKEVHLKRGAARSGVTPAIAGIQKAQNQLLDHTWSANTPQP